MQLRSVLSVARTLAGMLALRRRVLVSTFGQLVADIREDLNRGSSFDPRIKRAIVNAIAFYRSKRLGFNIKRARARLTSGNEFVSLPTDWIEADYLRLEKGTRRYPLEEVTYDWMEETQLDDSTEGQPQKFAIQHRELRLYPIPDQTYTLMLSFQYELKNVSISASDGESNAWLEEGEELVRKHAMGDLYVLYIDGDEAKMKGMNLLAECEEVILPKLEAEAAREQSSGKIKAWI
jgi:hypothetical protein